MNQCWYKKRNVFVIYFTQFREGKVKLIPLQGFPTKWCANIPVIKWFRLLLPFLLANSIVRLLGISLSDFCCYPVLKEKRSQFVRISITIPLLINHPKRTWPEVTWKWILPKIYHINNVLTLRLLATLNTPHLKWLPKGNSDNFSITLSTKHGRKMSK